MRLVDDEGRVLPNDGKAVGHLQASTMYMQLGISAHKLHAAG
jgi:hypothetical protein